MRRFARQRPFDAGFLLGAVVSCSAYAWVLSGGFPLAARTGSRLHYYTFAAMSLLHGRLDVPEAALAGECFLIRGRCYGYFGITPSLLRLPVALVAGDRSFSNHVEIFFFALGFAVVVAGVLWLARQLVAAWAAPATTPRLRIVGFIVASSIAASPLLFLASRPLVYEEAILWGVASGTLALAAAVSVWRRPRAAGIAVLLLADLLGVLARPTVGASGILATLYVGYRLLKPRPATAACPEARPEPDPMPDQDPDRGPSRAPGSHRGRRRTAGGGRARHVTWGSLLLVGAAMTFASAPAMAYAKFGTPAPPYRYHSLVATRPDLLGPLNHHSGINAAVIPTKLLSSARPDSLRFLRHPPYLQLGESAPSVVWPARRSDVVGEPTAGIPATLPFTTLAAIAGLGWTTTTLRRPRRERAGTPAAGAALLVLVSACAAVGAQLAFAASSYRYLGDWFPFLASASTVGLAAAAVRLPSHPRRRAAIAMVGAVLLATQLVIQVGLAVQNGLDTGGERPATCTAGGNPYGKLGEVFCPLER